VLPLDMVDNSFSPCERLTGCMLVIGQAGRPPLPEVRLYPRASASTFTDSLAT